MKFRYIIIFISLNFLNSQSQNLYPNIGTEIMFQPEWGKKSGHHIFKLDVYSNNSSAINAYQKAGFKGEELNMIFNLK